MAARPPDGMIERYHMDLEASLYGDLVTPVKGRFVVPTGPGLGCDPDPDVSIKTYGPDPRYLRPLARRHDRPDRCIGNGDLRRHKAAAHCPADKSLCHGFLPDCTATKRGADFGCGDTVAHAPPSRRAEPAGAQVPITGLAGLLHRRLAERCTPTFR
mgnify:CR=1 FL=1